MRKHILWITPYTEHELQATEVLKRDGEKNRLPGKPVELSILTKRHQGVSYL